MVKEFSNGLMDLTIREIGIWGKSKAMAFMCKMMGGFIMDNGRLI